MEKGKKEEEEEEKDEKEKLWNSTRILFFKDIKLLLLFINNWYNDIMVCFNKKNTYILEIHNEVFTDEVIYLEYASK